MALIHSFEKSGNFLFRHRGEIPLILIVLAIPVILLTPYKSYGILYQEILCILAIIFSITGFLIRAYSIGTTPKGTSGRNTDKQVAESLNKTGIYSMVRHPLYLGNYFMWTGIVLFTFNIYFAVIVSLAFWLYYERIMFAEERFLEKKFGQPYLDWSQSVPAFIPSFRNYQKSEIRFSLKSVLRREYSGFLATVLCFTFIDLLRHYLTSGAFSWQRPSVYICLGSVIITLVLRNLKHYTSLLDEAGRS
ncbi:MAG: isoprenylcysteine carboxylmethyltransferase family protein [Bacteroidales bacterium]|nr:isoprenylcysteine carboxylmethyltransferase family protein [Bacteroidales bacterium]